MLDFFQRTVNDLKFCKTFPWGRLSFDHMLRQIPHTMTHFGGVVKEGTIWLIPGFIIPMELLEFEAIPALRDRFRESIPGADMSCPRMCRAMFKRSEMRGFPFELVNESLGTTKDIFNLLVASDEEEELMVRITEKDDFDDNHDVVVSSWMNQLRKGNCVRFEDLYDEDVAARLEAVPQNVVDEEIGANSSPENTRLTELVELVNSMKEETELVELRKHVAN